MLYTKELPVIGEFDVAVCGAGPAGFCAAVQAARAGARTALVEQNGMPGGVLTVGGNPEIGLFFSGTRQVIAGIGWELVEQLAVQGWAEIPDFSAEAHHSQQNVHVNAVMAAVAMDEMAGEAGVQLLLHHTVCDAIVESERINGVVMATKTGLGLLRANVFIDATGDGDLSAYAGAAYLYGGDSPEDLQPGTLRFYLSGYNLQDIDKQQVEYSFRSALAEGRLQQEDFWSADGSPYTIFAANGNNINHVAINAADSIGRTQAEQEGRQSVARLVEWARTSVKGAEHIQAVICAPHTAVRESRRILCDHTITAEEYVQAQPYADGICYSYYPIDLHKKGADSLYNRQIEAGRIPQIPISALTVSKLDNLLVAGRCISGDRLAQSAYRVKASCMAMGQATGALAALASGHGLQPRAVSTEMVKTMLKQHGAIIPD